VVFAYTIKPVIYGGIVAWLRSVTGFYPMITGLGHVFMPSEKRRHYVVRKMVQLLYWLSLRRGKKAFFQNPDDISDFVAMGIIGNDKIREIKGGTGVDLQYYAPSPLSERCVFIMIARLLGEKGVREYIAAARILKNSHPEVEWLLVGDADDNPDSLSTDEIARLKSDVAVRYLGVYADIREAISMATVGVLPSYYREGIPRTIQEAMAMGRAVIVSNVPGCRETLRLPPGAILDKTSSEIITGENGFLVPVRNVEKLCQAMERLIAGAPLRETMGAASLDYAQERFDVRKVNEMLLAEMGL